MQPHGVCTCSDFLTLSALVSSTTTGSTLSPSHLTSSLPQFCTHAGQHRERKAALQRSEHQVENLRLSWVAGDVGTLAACMQVSGQHCGLQQ